MLRERFNIVAAVPPAAAALMCAYYGLFGPKKLAAVAGLILVTACAAWFWLRRRPRWRAVSTIVFLLAAAAVPFSEPYVASIVRRVRGTPHTLPPAPRGSTIDWTQPLTGAAPIVAPSPNDWPGWRGPDANGRAVNADPPEQWSETANVRWRSSVPGRGFASPCVIGRFIILAAADEFRFSQGLLCYDANDGRLLWASKLFGGQPPNIHLQNSYASSTPCSDGRLIYAVFDADHDGRHGLWASATDLAGRIQWRSFVTEFDNKEGYGSSPTLKDGILYIAADAGNAASLTALDCATGKVRWRTPRPTGFSFGNPVVADTAGRRQVLIHGSKVVTAYDPVTGRELWSCSGLPEKCGGSPIWDDQCVYVSGGYPDKILLAVRADGSGDVTNSKVLWKNTTAVPYISSMTSFDGHLFGATNEGVLTCLEASTGKMVRRARLSGGVSASLVIAGRELLVTTEDGTVHVFEATPQLKSIAENKLSKGGFASPAVVGNAVYLRTDDELICIQRR